MSRGLKARTNMTQAIPVKVSAQSGAASSAAKATGSVGRGSARMRVHQRVRHPRKIHAGSAMTQALHVGAGAFEEKKKLVREALGLVIAGSAAKIDQPRAVLNLALLGDNARRMVLFRKLDGGIRHGTSAKIIGAEIFTDPLGQSAEPGIRIAGIGAQDFIVARDRFLVHRAQIF